MNAGANGIDNKVVIDETSVTSRSTEYPDASSKKIIEEPGEYMQALK